MIFAENDIGAADSQDVLNLERLNEKLKDHPCDFDTLLRKALLLSCPFYRSDKASIVFDLLISLYPNSYEVYFWYGLSEHIYVGNREKAMNLLRKTIDINPQKADAYIILGHTLRMISDSYDKEVELLFKQALRLEPTWPNGWYSLGCFLIEKKRYVEARQIIQNALCHIPTNYVESDDIIQGRHDELVSGRAWTPCMNDDLQKYLQSIEIEEAKIKKSNEYSS